MNTAPRSVSRGDRFTCDVNAARRAAPGGIIYEDDHWIADRGTLIR